MSISVVSVVEDPQARRWREWQLQNELGERRRGTRARIVFTILFVSVAGWLGLQILINAS